jgi:sporulation protein YlmC with PRC-barrel domain
MSRSFRKEDVVGKTVIETSGLVKGKVKDVTFNLSNTVTLVVEGADGKDFRIPLSRVTGISDHVVVKSDLASELPAIASGTSCKFCGAPMIAGDVWCPSCNKSQS